MGRRFESKTELRRAVEKKLNQQLEDAVWEEYAPDWSAPYDVQDLNDLLAMLKDARLGAKEPEIVPPQYIKSDLLSDIAIYWIHQCRTYLFGSTNPPFNELEDMRNWIENQAKKQPLPKGHAPRFGYYFDSRGLSDEELEAAIERFKKENPGPHGLEFANLDYPGRNGIVVSVPVSDGNAPLRHLWLVVQKIVQELDCEAYQATVIILTDKPILIPSISVKPTLSFRKATEPSWKIEITIREPVSVETITIVYRKLREQLWGVKRNLKYPSRQEAELVKFVKSQQDQMNPSWDHHLREWNIRFPEWRYENWRYFRVAFKRAYRKVYPETYYDVWKKS